MSPNRDAMMKLRAKWKALGLCSRCGGERTNKFLKTCELCRKSDPRVKPKAA